jgi:hypothetical protein
MISTNEALSRFPGELFALLLIFFMVATAIRVEGYAVELDLLDAGNGAELVRPENPHHLAVLSNGAIILDGETVGIQEIEGLLALDGRPVQLHAELPPVTAQILTELQRLQTSVLLAVETAKQPPGASQ